MSEDAVVDSSRDMIDLDGLKLNFFWNISVLCSMLLVTTSHTISVPCAPSFTCILSSSFPP